MAFSPSGTGLRRPVLLLTAALLLPLFARAQTPYRLATEFILQGTVTAAPDAPPLERARLLVLTSDGADTLTIVFTSADGTYTTAVDVEVTVNDPPETLPAAFSVTPAYPNPVSSPGPVTLHYTAPPTVSKPPTLLLFDLLGRRMSLARPLAGGIYFYRLDFGDGHHTETHKLVVLGGGVLAFDVVPTSGARPSTQALPSPRTLRQTTNPLDVVLYVDKAGFISQEHALTLAEDGPTEANFALEPAPAPTAAFAVSGSTRAGEPALFDASASIGANEEALRYHWDFGDGRRGGGQQTAHVFTEAGTHTVALTVTGAYGATHTITQDVVITDPPAPVSLEGHILGLIRSVAGGALPDVEVRVAGSDVTGATTMSGAVELSGVGTDIDLVLQLEKPGYTAQYVRLHVPEASKQAYFEAVMQPRAPARAIPDAEFGTMQVAHDGLRIEVPVEGLMRSDGSLVTGEVDLRMTPVDVTNVQKLGAFPGQFEGLTPDGDRALLLSYGVAEFAFEQDGEALNLAPGKTAAVELPVYPTGSAVGDTIPLWSMDPNLGRWVLEGQAVVEASAASPTGLVARAEVGHFSWWNLDKRDEDPNDADGICYVWECFNAICNKRPEFCWIEGAFRDEPGKRQVEGPVFSARTFFGPDGGSVQLPGDRDVTLRGTLVQEGVLLRGDTTLFAEAGGAASFELRLDTVDTGTLLTVPADITGTLTEEGQNDIYTFEATAGQVLGISVGRTTGSALHEATLFAPDGTELFDSNLNSPVARPYRLSQTGLYTIIFSSYAAQQTTYYLKLRAPQGALELETDQAISMAEQDIALYTFETEAERSLNVGMFIEESFGRPRLWVYDAEVNILAVNSEAETRPFTSGVGTHYLFIHSHTIAKELSIGIAADDPDARQTLAFDADGMATYSGRIAVHGQRHYLAVPAEAGDGIEIILNKGTEAAPAMQFKLFREDGTVLKQFGATSWLEDVYEGYGQRLPETGTYHLTIEDAEQASIGDFEVVIHKAASGATQVVDDDLACAGATTSSLVAALYAVNEDGTATICNGVYNASARPTLDRAGVTVAGESQDGVIVRFTDLNRTPGGAFDIATTLDGTPDNVTLRNFTVQPGTKPPSTPNNAFYVNASDARVTFEDLTVEPMPGETNVGAAILSSGMRAATIRTLTHRNEAFNPQALDVRVSEAALLENSSLEGTTTIRRDLTLEAQPTLTVTETTVTGNLTVSSGGEVMITNNTVAGVLQVTNSAAVKIEGNMLNANDFQGSGRLDLERNAQATVRGNTLATGMRFLVDDGTLLADGNLVTMTAPASSSMGVEINFTDSPNGGGGIITLQNTVIRDAPTFVNLGVIRATFVDFAGALRLFHNTIQYDPTSNTGSVPSVYLTTRDNAFTGALPVTMVNNLFVGGVNTQGVRLPAATTIDGDYNLFYNYATRYDGGTSSTGTNDLTDSDPLLTGDLLVPDAGSPALNAGASQEMYPDLPATDYDGTARPAGPAPDLGAHEQE